MNIKKIDKQSGIPLIGNIAFGIVDRGSSCIQIRPISLCNMSCIFCSTDVGPKTTTHKTGYIVDPDYLIQEVNNVVEIKEEVHANIDSVGEPASYEHLTYLIQELKKNKKIYFISMQSNGTYFTKEKIDELEKAGLNRIHLSIHSTDPEQCKELFGSQEYDINQILEVARHISKSKIELMLAPVLLPNINEEEVEKLVELSKELNCKIGIQKYEEYKFSRKPKKVKKENYYKFYKRLEAWEKKHEVKLIYKHERGEIYKGRSLEKPIEIGERINTTILSDGWNEGQGIAAYKGRSITVKDCKAQEGDKINLKVLENKSNIYLAKRV